MKTLWYPELMQHDSYRKPQWRWDRANYIVRNRRCYSIKSDDRATGITVGYLRALAGARSEARRTRVLERYRFLSQAQQIFEDYGIERLELECRILARQNDMAIGYAMELPCESVQAYRDIFFAVDDRIDATSYIVRAVIGIRGTEVPTVPQLMLLCAYQHGPGVIDAWVSYLGADAGIHDLSTPQGRLHASIDLFVRLQQFDISQFNDTKKLKIVKLWDAVKTLLPTSTPVKRSIRHTTEAMMTVVEFTAASLPACSYAPSTKPYKPFYTANGTKKCA